MVDSQTLISGRLLFQNYKVSLTEYWNIPSHKFSITKSESQMTTIVRPAQQGSGSQNNGNNPEIADNSQISLHSKPPEDCACHITATSERRYIWATGLLIDKTLMFLSMFTAKWNLNLRHSERDFTTKLCKLCFLWALDLTMLCLSRVSSDPRVHLCTQVSEILVTSKESGIEKPRT